MNNSTWAHCLIDQLIQQGVVDFCIAPGSRSTTLALAAARHPKARLKVHFDERGLGFYAIGLIQADSKPAALIVTSGTAVGNLLPAVMEAHHSNLPLILLTADRPPELRDSCANQTSDQVKIFQNFTRWSVDLPCSSPSLGEDYIRSQAVHAVFQSMKKGPVHLNCQFREPLFESPTPQQEGVSQSLFIPPLGLTAAAKVQAEQLLQSTSQGLILIGRLPAQTDLTPILDLAKKLRWPIFADLLSQVRCFEERPEVIQHFDFAVRCKTLPAPEVILYFGERFTWKFLPMWVKEQQATILHVHGDAERVDHLHTRPHRFLADPVEFCQALEIEQAEENSWLESWQKIDAELEQDLEECFEEPHPFTEPDLMREIGKQLPEDWSLFLASSMPIRDVEHFLFAKKPRAYFCNRGLAGIDGQIATAVGAAVRLKGPMVAILGDQSTLHDLNSIALLKGMETPFLLVVSNNFGSGIFSYLPIANEPEYFDKICGASHNIRFDKIAEMFQIPYKCCSDGDLTALFDFSGPCIVEVFTSREENTCFQKKILEKCSSKKQGGARVVLSHSK